MVAADQLKELSKLSQREVFTKQMCHSVEGDQADLGPGLG